MSTKGIFEQAKTYVNPTNWNYNEGVKRAGQAGFALTTIGIGAGAGAALYNIFTNAQGPKAAAFNLSKNFIANMKSLNNPAVTQIALLAAIVGFAALGFAVIGGCMYGIGKKANGPVGMLKDELNALETKEANAQKAVNNDDGKNDEKTAELAKTLESAKKALADKKAEIKGLVD